MVEKFNDTLINNKDKNFMIYELYNKIVKLFNWIVYKDIDLSHIKVLIGYSIIIVLLEFFSFSMRGNFSFVASRLWIFGWFICSMVIISLFVKSVIKDIKNKRILMPIVVMGIFAILIGAMGNIDKIVIGQDATQQLAAGMKSFSVPDWNYTGKAFLGYPNRQYVLAAIPSLILGRSVKALQIGFAYPFYLSIMILYISFRKFAKSSGVNELISLVAITALFVFPYVTEYYIYFEHTLFPACFTMQAIGWLILFIKKPTLFHAFTLIWTCTMMANCYTPAIASVALFVMIIFLIGVFSLLPASKELNVKLNGKLFFYTCLNISVVIGLFTLFTFIFGRSDRVTEVRNANLIESLLATKEGYKIFLLNTPSVFSGIFIIVIFIYLILSLIYKLGPINLIVSLWVLAIVGMSQFLKGYAIYEPSISMSRTLITVPVLVSAIYIEGLKILRKKKMLLKPALIIFLITLNLGIGIYNLNKPVVQGDATRYFNPSTIQPMKYLVDDMYKSAKENGLQAEGEQSIILYTNNMWLSNLRDYTSYFFPNANVLVLKKEQSLPKEMNFSDGGMIYTDDGINIDGVIEKLQIEDKKDLYFELNNNKKYIMHKYIVTPKK